MLKEFWKNNKKEYLISCLVILFCSFFIFKIKKVNFVEASPFLVFSVFLLVFIFSYGIYEFTGGDK